MVDAPPLESRRGSSGEPLGKLYACLEGLEGLTSEYTKGEMLWLELPCLVAKHTGALGLGCTSSHGRIKRHIFEI